MAGIQIAFLPAMVFSWVMIDRLKIRRRTTSGRWRSLSHWERGCSVLFPEQ